MKTHESLLTSLSEECMEVAQRCCKANRFGLTEIEPKQSLTNEERIVEEAVDFLAVLEMLEEAGLIHMPTGHELNDRKNTKKHKVRKYMEYSKKLGTLDLPYEPTVVGGS